MTIIQTKPRALKSTWIVESPSDVLNSYGVSRPDKPLKPSFKTATRTVKQRNKLMCNHFVGSYNKDVLQNRKMIAVELDIINSMANEIRKEIDNKIIRELNNEREN